MKKIFSILFISFLLVAQISQASNTDNLQKHYEGSSYAHQVKEQLKGDLQKELDINMSKLQMLVNQLTNSIAELEAELDQQQISKMEFISDIEMLSQKVANLEQQLEQQSFAYEKALSQHEVKWQKVIENNEAKLIVLLNQKEGELQRVLLQQKQDLQKLLQNIIYEKDEINSNLHSLLTDQSQYIRNISYSIGAIFIFLLLLIIFLYRKNQKSLEELQGTIGTEKILDELLPQLSAQEVSSNGDEEINHDFTLKVAGEIARLYNNIARLDQEDKRVKPLLKGLERIEANFLANGYEIVNLLGEKYDGGMILDVINFIHSDDLEEGTQIITKVVRPQVLYNGKLIQRAQVEVTQN